jgi:hypothetical protein
MAGLDGIQGPSDKFDAHNEVLGRHAVLAWLGLVQPGSALFDLLRQHGKFTVGEEDGICFVGREYCQ